jgi:hypothetical protein
MKPVIVFAFNSSIYAPQPWIEDGRFTVVSVDWDDTDHSEAHRPPEPGHTVFKANLTKASGWEMIRKLEPSLIVSFAPCTDLAVSGARHFKAKAEADPKFQTKAAAAARAASLMGCPYVVENPVSRLSTLWRRPDITVSPFEFAGYCPEGPHPEFPEVIPEQDRYHKRTCLWYGRGFNMPKRKIMMPFDEDNPGWRKLGGKSARTKYIRSLTPRGLARAIYEANAEQL